MSIRDWVQSAAVGSPMIGARARAVLLRSLGARVGRSRIEHSSLFKGDLRKLEIEDGVYINAGAFIFPTGGISIGKNVYIGPRVTIATGSHAIGPTSKRADSTTRFSPVVVEAGCWLGASVTVLPGVRIGRGSVVAAGSVVSTSLEPNGLYGGMPARLIRELD